MILDNVTEFTIYHCGTDNHNKVWGYFLYGTLMWAFWGGVGKSWTFKCHGSDNPWSRVIFQDLVAKKERKAYCRVDQTQLDVWDSSWRERFNDRFTYFLLQQAVI